MRPLSEMAGWLLHRLGLQSRLAPLAHRDRNFVRSRMRQALQDYYAAHTEATGWLTLPNGREFFAHLNDEFVRQFLDHGRIAESVETEYFSSLLRDGDIVFDVGANHGVFTLLALPDTIRAGMVHLFEPNHVVARRLRRTCSRNQSLPLHVHEIALSREDGVTAFHAPKEGMSGHGSLERHQWGIDHDVFADASGIPVAVRTIDSFAREHGITRVDGMKIDVEGHELAVVQGMGSLLSVRPPRVILCETSMHSDAWTALRSHYRTVRAVVGGVLTEEPGIPPGFWGNFFFVEPLGSAT